MASSLIFLWAKKPQPKHGTAKQTSISSRIRFTPLSFQKFDKMAKVFLSFAIVLSILFNVYATDPYPRNYSIDIQHYRFSIELNDSTNVIEGHAEITILFKKPELNFALDFIEKNNDRYGMTVQTILHKENPLKFSHKNNRLQVTLNAMPMAGEKITLLVNYYGTPADGLVISRNKFGDRTFFGDNWPDRARHWLPTIDHPYDKATCEFIVVAPDHYQSIANGSLIEKRNLPKGRMLTHWREDARVPTKVMVIGVAHFATTVAGEINGVPIETWVYPQNQQEGFFDFKVAPQITQYFISQIGSFPYQKLANVQSTTRYGGMENASNIFYFENSVTGKNEHEDLIAHEIAHQWFGDSASENDWYHVWLSEGFATYLTNLYYEATYGREQLVARMQKQRDEVVQYFKKNPSPVIDTTVVDINKVLNTNSYQKASWVLHMLRKEVGDEAFWVGIREYYKTYQHSNAVTSDFMAIMEKASGKNLNEFFTQWLRKGDHPRLDGTWTYDTKEKQVMLFLEQTQPNLFDVPLEIGLVAEDGSAEKKGVRLTTKNAEFTFPARMRPKNLVLDPDTWLLFEGKIQAK